MKLTKLMVFCFSAFLFLGYAQAQEVTVKGKIYDESGLSIPGATILVKSTSKSSVSDFDGFFEIKAPSNGILKISFVGYKTIEESINGRTQINVSLKPQSQDLQEVVVVGYGTQKKKDVTSAISTVNVNDISSRPIVSAVEAITGKAAGIQVANPSGAPGGELSVRVRGIGSPNGGEPLYVVDGVITSNLKAIDPNSIKSINVLKDASAAGIYGAAGSSNGVVIVTTKQGTKGKPLTELNFYTAVQQIVKKLPVLNNAQWLDLQKEITGADVTVPAYYDLQNTNNNWQDLVYRQALQRGVSMSTSGGSDTGKYYLGLGYLDQDGIILGSNFKRYSAKFSNEQKATKYLKLGGNLSYNRTYQQTVKDNASANFGGVVTSALTTPEYIPIYMPAGSPTPGVYGVSSFYSGENPISSIYNSTNETIGNNLLGDVYAEITLPFNIKFKSQFNSVLETSKRDYFMDPYSSLSGISKKGEGSSTYSEIFRWGWDNTLNYTKQIKDHNFDVILGTAALNESIATSFESGQGFATNSVPTLNAASSNYVISTGRFEWSTNSYFGRLNYGYDNRYLFTATFRTDGSSRVGTNVVWGSFPAASAGWNVSNEKFMENVTFVKNLKLRAGWGKTGNLPPYSLLYPSYSLINAGSPYAYNGTSALPGINPGNQLGNSDLKWESANQTNVGLDVGFLNNRLNLTVDYYHKKVKDMIFTQQLPLTTGGAVTALNLPGYNINKGIEFALDADIIRSEDFNWNSNFNISFNDNIIQGIDPTISFQTGPVTIGGSAAPIYTQIIKNGYSLGTFWGYRSKGVDPQTGNLVYGDQPESLGSALPKYTAGFTNEFSYKSFTLSILMDAVQGNKVYNATRMETEALSGYANESAAVLRRWRQPGDITDIPRALNNGTTNTAAAAMLQSRVSSHYIEDGSFVRLKNVSLSYELDKDLIKKLGISGFRMYVTAQNLFTITNYKGYYPEVNGYGQGTNNQAANAGASTSLMSLGIDRGTYPAAKTYTLGFNVQL